MLWLLVCLTRYPITRRSKCTVTYFNSLIFFCSFWIFKKSDYTRERIKFQWDKTNKLLYKRKKNSSYKAIMIWNSSLPARLPHRSLLMILPALHSCDHIISSLIFSAANSFRLVKKSTCDARDLGVTGLLEDVELDCLTKVNRSLPSKLMKI